MSMCRTSDVLRTSSILNCQHSLRNHLTSVRSNDVHSQNPIGLLLHQKLDISFGIQIGLCSRVGNEGEFADFVLDVGSFEFLFGLAYPGDFGVGIDDGGDGVVVDMTVTGFDKFDGGDTCEEKPMSEVGDDN